MANEADGVGGRSLKSFDLIEAAKALELQSSEYFRQIADNLQEVFALSNADLSEFLYVNQAYRQIWGRTPESLYAHPMSFVDGVHQDDRKRFEEALQGLVNGNSIDDLECRVVRPDGSTAWVSCRGYPVRDAQGQIHRLVGSAQEITERKRAEDKLRESEDRYRDLVEHSQDLICTHDLQGILLSVNEPPLRILGYSREELLNKPLRDFVTAEARPHCDAYLSQIQRDGFAKGLLPVLTKSGKVKLWEFNNSLRRDGVASPVVRGIAHDVTEQKLAEAAQRRSEEKFSKAFRSSPVEMTICTLAEGRFLDVNESFEQNIGFAREELIGRTALELGLWINPADIAATVEEVQKNGRVVNREIQLRAKSGEIEIKLYSAELIQIGGESCSLSVSTDITKRKRAEEELRQAKERTDSVLASVADVHILFDRQWRYLYVNEAAVRAMGRTREQILGHTLWELYPDIVGTELERQYHRGMNEHFPFAFDFHYTTNDTWWNNRFHPAPEGLAVFATNITDHKRAEERLLRSEAFLTEGQRLTHTGSWGWNPNSGDLTWSLEMFRIFGHDSLTAKPTLKLFLRCVHPDDRTRVERLVERVVLEKCSFEFDYRIVLADNSVKHIHVVGRPVLEPSGELIEIIGTAMDVTERKRAEEVVRQLSGRLLHLQDKERRNIARDLHDTTGQNLVAVATLLGQIHSSIPSSNWNALELVSQCEELTNQCLREIRTLSYALFPPMLDEAGIESAIRNYASGFTERTGIRVELQGSSHLMRMPHEIELALFRVVQESLVNIQRHSGSQTATISLDRKPGIVLLEVSDKGRGMPSPRQDQNGTLPPTLGVGIPSMIERVKHIGGRLDIESSGVGTTIRVAVLTNDSKH